MGKNKKRKEWDGIIYSDDDSQWDGEQETLAPEDQDLRIWLDRRGGNKVVTMVKGFVGTDDDRKDLAKTLKSKCGVGGSVSDDDILVQGDHRDKVVKILSDMGYRCKKAGG